jgi:hypothetical protein
VLGGQLASSSLRFLTVRWSGSSTASRVSPTSLRVCLPCPDVRHSGDPNDGKRQSTAMALSFKQCAATSSASAALHPCLCAATSADERPPAPPSATRRSSASLSRSSPKAGPASDLLRGFPAELSVSSLNPSGRIPLGRRCRARRPPCVPLPVLPLRRPRRPQRLHRRAGLPEVLCSNAGAEIVVARTGVALADVNFPDADASMGTIQRRSSAALHCRCSSSCPRAADSR